MVITFVDFKFFSGVMSFIAIDHSTSSIPEMFEVFMVRQLNSKVLDSFGKGT